MNAADDVITPEKDAREASEKFDYVRFTVADVHGMSRCKSVAKRNFAQVYADGIVMFSGVTILGTLGELDGLPDEIKQVNYGNMVVKPVPGTLHELPWASDGDFRVGEVFCESYWEPTFRNGEIQQACSRYVARRQLEKLKQLGYRLFSGYEAEFMVLSESEKPAFDGNLFLLGQEMGRFEPYLYSIESKCARAGIDIYAIHLEYSSGQFEMVMSPKYGMEAADQMFLFKQGVKEITNKYKSDWQATFMSQPALKPNELGNGLHYSHSLWSIDSGLNAFYDAEAVDQHRLSTVSRHWLAGLLRHAPAMAALCSPTVNCYRRVGGSSFAPAVANWDVQDRFAMIRVKPGHPVNTYMENRLPGGSANPYLVMAATVAAGIDGLVNKLELPPSKSAAATDGQSSQGMKLPRNLSEALDALENDKVMCDALGHDFVTWFTRVKRNVEIAKAASAAEAGHNVLKLERDLYLKYL